MTPQPGDLNLCAAMLAELLCRGLKTNEVQALLCFLNTLCALVKTYI